MDLSTQPEAPVEKPGPDLEGAKRLAAERRNATRSTNKQVNATFVKEVKVSLAGGRPPEVNVSESQTHMKARWHLAAKEVAYKLLDLRKEGWKAYSMFEKAKVHKEMNKLYKFDLLIDPKRVENYLAQHFRSSRALWKAHWLKYGDDNRHPNCPKEAWDKLIKWPTEACMEDSADMAGRRSKVLNKSKLGRKHLIDRMDEEVRSRMYALYCYGIPAGCVLTSWHV